MQVLQLIFALMLTEGGQLDPAYIDQLPWQRKMLNIPHILHHHFNHQDTRLLLPRLLPLLHSMGPSAMRLLRVLCGTFFRPDWYGGSRSWIGKGAYAQVCSRLSPLHFLPIPSCYTLCSTPTGVAAVGGAVATSSGQDPHMCIK